MAELNLSELLRAIRKDVIKNGSTVLSADNPQDRTIGFSVFHILNGEEHSRLYQIDLGTIHEDPAWPRFRSNFISGAKRRQLAARLMSKECLVICLEHDEYDSECNECVNLMIASVMLS
jgi:hypothetical protein